MFEHMQILSTSGYISYITNNSTIVWDSKNGISSLNIRTGPQLSRLVLFSLKGYVYIYIHKYTYIFIYPPRTQELA